MGLQYTMMTNTWVLQKVHGQTTKSSFCCKKMEIQECSSLYKVYGKYVSWKICNDFKMKFIFLLLRISFVLHNFFLIVHSACRNTSKHQLLGLSVLMHTCLRQSISIYRIELKQLLDYWYQLQVQEKGYKACNLTNSTLITQFCFTIRTQKMCGCGIMLGC